MGYEMRIFSSPSLMLMRLRVKNSSDFKEEQNSSRDFTTMMSHPARIGWVCREQQSNGVQEGTEVSRGTER